ncbi:type II toxin-antitoxin system Phd/YefM family antitoxin [Deferrisoma sp.]
MARIQVNMHEAKTRLSELARRARQGDRVVIARAGEPYVDLVPHREERAVRVPGLLKGRVRIAPDFDETPEDVIRAFEGGSCEGS